MAKTVEIPEDMLAFAQAEMEQGNYGNLTEVIREAFGLLQERRGKVDELRQALDVGIEELDSGRSHSGSPRELMDEIRQELDLARAQ